MSRVLPILFNTEMVRAILDGRKTVTRRAVKPRYKDDEYGFQVMTNMGTGERWLEKTDEEEMTFDTPRYINPPYQPGDILYVRETWSDHYTADSNGKLVYCYKADGYDLQAECLPGEYNRWYPPIYMPKAAARIWLKVTDVRVEHLPDMTLDDFLREGVVIRPEAFNDPENAYGQAKNIFVEIWNPTIKESDQDLYGWDANPWVWVIEFERCDKPKPCIMKGMEPAEADGKYCLGYSRGEDDDEPCEMCKYCSKCSGNNIGKS